MTQDYYGTKRITAWPQTKDGREGYAVKYPDGYTSWSPKETFDGAYQPLTAMSFGHAIEAMRAGNRVARAGWNGKGMYVAIQPGSVIDAAQARGGAAKFRAAETSPTKPNGDAQVTILPHVDMRAADGAIVVGWLASQTDMLANDWQIVAEPPAVALAPAAAA